MGFPRSISNPDRVPSNYKKDREPDLSWYRPSYHRPNNVTNTGDYDPRTGRRRKRWFWDDDGEDVEMRGNSNDPDRYWAKESRELFGNPHYLNEMSSQEIEERKRKAYQNNPYLVDLLDNDKGDTKPESKPPMQQPSQGNNEWIRQPDGTLKNTRTGKCVDTKGRSIPCK
jgi:hypothetical protein